VVHLLENLRGNLGFACLPTPLAQMARSQNCMSRRICGRKDQIRLAQVENLKPGINSSVTQEPPTMALASSINTRRPVRAR